MMEIWSLVIVNVLAFDPQLQLTTRIGTYNTQQACQAELAVLVQAYDGTMDTKTSKWTVTECSKSFVTLPSPKEAKS